MTEELWPTFKKYKRLCAILSERVMKEVTSKFYEIEEDYVIAD